MMKPFNVFCDGSCRPNPGHAAVGGVVFDPAGAEVWRGSVYLGETFRVGSVIVERATNQSAELAAVLFVLAHVPPDVPVVVHTDSMYVVGLVNSGWTARANVELVALVRTTVSERRAQLQWVPGHSGIAGNELADVLAGGELDTLVAS
jgi:ribonuclease HI